MGKWGLLSKHRVSLMAFAMIWIFLHHGTQMELEFPAWGEWINIVFHRGYAGVDIFLFLSGIGLYYSFRKDDNIRRFYKKRMMRVLMPYLMIGGAFWVLSDILMKKDILLFLEDITMLSFWKDGITRVWYVALILALYAVFPLIWMFVYREGRIRKARLILLIAIVIGANAGAASAFPEWYDKVEVALTRIPIFLVGLFVAESVWENKKIRVWELLLLLILLIFSRICIHVYQLDGAYSRYWCAVLAICISLVLSVFFEISEKNHILCKLKELLVPIGKWSLELYIIHVWVRRLLLNADISYVVNGYNLNKYGILQFLMLVVISGVLAWFAVSIEKKIFYNKKQ